MIKTFFGVALAAVLGTTLPASAQSIESAYTEIDLDDCVMMDSYELGASFACPGYKGYPLYIAEGDLRMFVSYGFGAPDEIAAGQTFPAFNTINKTLEWRLVETEYGWKPFATILRFFTQSGDGSEPDGQFLVVTTLAPGNTCHVAYIDAKRVSNANELARDYADGLATVFDCERDEPARIPD